MATAIIFALLGGALVLVARRAMAWLRRAASRFPTGRVMLGLGLVIGLRVHSGVGSAMGSAPSFDSAARSAFEIVMLACLTATAVLLLKLARSGVGREFLLFLRTGER